MSTLVVRELLLKILTNAGQAIGVSGVLPILRNFKFEASERGIEVSATDLEISITDKCPVISCSAPFAVAVPAEQLLGLLKVLNEDILTLAMDGNFLAVKTAGSSNRIKTIPVEEYHISWDVGKPVAKILAAELKKMVALVTLSALTEGTQEDVFVSVCFRATKNGPLVASATDRFRYSIYEVKCDCGKEWTALIPAKMLVKVAKVLAFEDVVVGLDDKKITFQCEGTTVSVQSMSGKYPDIDSFPRTYEEGICAVVPTASMVSACKQIGLFAGEHRLMVMDFSELFLGLSTSSENGTSEINLSIGHKGTKQSMKIHCNPDYMADILQSVESSSITMQMRDKHAPVLITSENFVHGIMPFHQ